MRKTSVFFVAAVYTPLCKAANESRSVGKPVNNRVRLDAHSRRRMRDIVALGVTKLGIDVLNGIGYPCDV